MDFYEPFPFLSCMSSGSFLFHSALFSICSFSVALHCPVLFYSALSNSYSVCVRNISSLRQELCLLGSVLLYQSLEISLGITVLN